MSAGPSADPFGGTALLDSLPGTLSIHSVRGAESLDYAELVRRVSDRADRLSDLVRIEAGRIVIALADPIEVLVSLFATWAAGHCAVLVNPELAADERSRVIESVAPHLWLDAAGPQLSRPDQAKPPTPPGAALILMTSGTTGVPKGVIHSLDTLKTRLRLNVAEIGPATLARTLCPLPLFFGHGLIGNCLTPLFAGQRVHLLDSPGMPEFAAFGSLIDAHDITFLSSVPSMWRMILRLSPSPAQPPLRIHVGSAPLAGELWRQIEQWCGTQHVFNTYGMTETANWIAGGLRPAQDADGFVGAPWGGKFQVLRDGALCESGRGEVALVSPSLMLGLWGQSRGAEAREAAFLTGDIGELSADQSLRLVGRLKNEINRAGIKVLAEEVDMLLERHPDVVEACAFGLTDSISGEIVAAAVKLRHGARLSSNDIIAWCRTHARRDAVPGRIAIVEEIAKTDRGKVAREIMKQRMKEDLC